MEYPCVQKYINTRPISQKEFDAIDKAVQNDERYKKIKLNYENGEIYITSEDKEAFWSAQVLYTYFIHSMLMILKSLSSFEV